MLSHSEIGRLTSGHLYKFLAESLAYPGCKSLQDGELKALVIKMLTDLIELGWKMKKQMKDARNEIKQNIQGTNSYRKETRTQLPNDLEQKEKINIQLKQNGETRIQKSEETHKPRGQPEMLQYPNYRGARRWRTTARNLKLIWTNNDGKLPQCGKGNRLPGSPGRLESPKEVGPKEEHTKAHHH